MSISTSRRERCVLHSIYTALRRTHLSKGLRPTGLIRSSLPLPLGYRLPPLANIHPILHPRPPLKRTNNILRSLLNTLHTGLRRTQQHNAQRSSKRDHPHTPARPSPPRFPLTLSIRLAGLRELALSRVDETLRGPREKSVEQQTLQSPSLSTRVSTGS
jgi:hypothetical protein